MIKKILRLIIAEGMLTEKQIAKKVGIQEATLQDILQLLVRRGLLRPSECTAPKDAGCSSCPMASGCNLIGDLGETYYVTDKGRMYANAGEDHRDLE